MVLNKVQKRDGTIVDFDIKRIVRVVEFAFGNLGRRCPDANSLAHQVEAHLESKFPKAIPTVEDVSDCIEEVLMENNFHDVMSSFIIYREYKRKLRQIKQVMTGSNEKTPLTLNAIRVLESRYLLRDEYGKISETPTELFWRVAGAIVKAEKNYTKNKDQVEELETKFHDMMFNLDFMPNTPTLMNAGTKLGQLSACFVLPIEDNIDSIFETLWHAAKVHQWVGGTGFSFSKIRPKGCLVSSTKGAASGPVSFIKIYDMETRVMNMGGKQRGANMAILRVDHPDIIEFITCKQREGEISNFNISVALTDDFMQALDMSGDYDLVDPHTKEVSGKMNAKSVFDLIVNMAWTNGEPGIVFIDEINKYNYVPNMGVIESTNPCGEQPLLPYESCNLGSINLANMLTQDGSVDWDKIKETVYLAVRFLDDVIDVNKYPLPQIDKVTKSSRKIGLGIMGWADMLVKLNIPYNSDDAIYLAEKIMKFINDAGVEASVELAKERGTFPAYSGSVWDKKGIKIRNSTITTIAPTGTISMIADCSSGVEPLFSIAYTKIALDEKEFVYVNKYFERVAKERGFYSEELMYKIAKEGSIQNIDEIPDDVKRVFVTTHDIDTDWHIRMQAAFQKHTHNAVSKTINMPYSATIQDVKEAYINAYKLGCKGVTVYREGSRNIEVLKRGVKKEEKTVMQKTIVNKTPKDQCPICKSKMHAREGCYTCQSCGYSKCSS